ncbi:hypothetical protein QE152_g6622 [Popillia japonica]|uniref:Peptidase C1A papain C-terminal domain-containing protein n=1 Tax=Popillia japonica TaxID=7064 RepID=A0AAW1MEM5_POPJA
MFNINKFTPQLGSSYIELPKQIKKKEACINVRNNDEGCFGWAVVSALYPVKKNSERVTKSEEDEKTDKDRMMRDGNYGRELDHALENLATVKKAKGVKKHIVRNRITFNDYLACLIENKQTVIEQKLFKSENHQVSTIKQTKVALSPHDDKRFIITGTCETLPWGDDKRFIITGTCETLPWGHYAIMNQHF